MAERFELAEDCVRLAKELDDARQRLKETEGEHARIKTLFDALASDMPTLERLADPRAVLHLAENDAKAERAKAALEAARARVKELDSELHATYDVLKQSFMA